jgi:hypothetical protein
VSDCPVCNTENATEQLVGYGDEYRWLCQRCGEFILEFASGDLLYILGDDAVKRGALSHWIRTNYQAQQKEPPDDQGGRRRVRLNSGLVNSIIQNRPHPPVKKQADNLILWIGDNVKIGGQCINIDELAVQAIVESATNEEFKFVSNYLRKRELIDDGIEPRVRGKVTLSFAGWERYQELKRATSDSRKAFMAMQYSNKQLSDIFEKVFRNAVAETGFDLSRLVDTPQPAGLIDDDLRVKIRASRFLVADLTDRNPGAYWEAGYAEGLGKPVIYTCEKERFENPDSCPHFDTNHHLTILWEWDPDKRKEAGEKLKATIRATLPAEAKLKDD